jgi:predicted histone-like DNA-binding protein
MAKYRLHKNTNVKSAGYNKYYARKAAGKLLTLKDIVAHMAGHNTAYSKGVITGVIADMVNCIRELAYEGNQVKIENLGIFQVSLKSKGVNDPTKFNATTDIQSKWQVRPTGECRMKLLGVTRAAGAELSWEEATDYTSPRTTAGD